MVGDHGEPAGLGLGGAQAGGHVAGEVEGAPAAHAEVEGEAGDEEGDDGAAEGDENGAGVLDCGLEFRGGGDVEGPDASADVDGDGAAKHAAGRGEVGIGVEQQARAVGAKAVIHFDVDEVLGEIEQPIEDLVDDHGHKDEAPEGFFAFGGGGGGGAVTIDGDEVEKARPFFVVLHERDTGGEGGVAGVDGPDDGLATDGIAAGVEAPGRAVGVEGCHELDHVEIGGVAGGGDGEIGGAIGALGGDERLEFGAPDGLNKAHAEDAGEFLLESAGGDVGGEFVAFDLFAGGEHAAGAVEAVDGEVHAALDLATEPFGEAVEALARLVVGDGVGFEGAPKGESDAGDNGDENREPECGGARDDEGDVVGGGGAFGGGDTAPQCGRAGEEQEHGDGEERPQEADGVGREPGQQEDNEHLGQRDDHQEFYKQTWSAQNLTHEAGETMQVERGNLSRVQTNRVGLSTGGCQTQKSGEPGGVRRSGRPLSGG